MRKTILILLSIICLSLSSCGYSLDENKGVFWDVNHTTGVDSECEHHMVYDYATNHDPYGIYGNGEYHYVRCSYGLYGSNCDFEPTYERHTRVFSGLAPYLVLQYNGKYYHVANFRCSECGSYSSGTEYVLCTDNSKTCKGDCEGALEYIEVIK